MPAKKQKAEPEVKRFEEIIAERYPQPSTRELVADAVGRRADSTRKIEAQEKDKKKLARKARNARILARHHGNYTSREYLREVAEADRAEARR
jgi:hypothetical protein